MFRSNMLSYTVVKIALFSAIIFLVENFAGGYFYNIFALNPLLVMYRGFIWQPVTYLFLHSIQNPLHLLLNMYLLVMFGMQVEEAMGSKRMWFYFFFCGIGAGIVIFLVGLIQFFSMGSAGPTIGSSGAVFGIMIAFAFYYPDAEILLFFVLPVKSKYLVFVYFALEVYYYMSGGVGNISHIGHLGGALFALIYFLIWGRNSRGFIARAKESSSRKKTEQKHEEKKERENDQKLGIVKKVISGVSLNDLSDDEYQLVMHYDVMYDEDIDVDRDAVTKRKITDHEFISLVRKYTQDESPS